MFRQLRQLGLLLVVLAGVSFALRVSPGAFCAQGVEIGKKVDTGVDVTISNPAGKETEFSIKVVKARMPGHSSLKGYTPLPDLSWVTLANDTVKVPANGEGKTRMYFNIPGEEKYYNQHWIFSVTVEPKGMSMFKAAIGTAYMIETKAKTAPDERPAGAIGVSPSVVNLIRGKTAGFTIYNNSGAARTYKIYPYTLTNPSETTLTVNNSKGFRWAGAASWIKPAPKQITLKKGGEYKVKLTADLPQTVSLDEQGVEGLVFVESNRGEKAFVRVWIEKD